MDRRDEDLYVARIAGVLRCLQEVDAVREAYAGVHRTPPTDLDHAVARLEECVGLLVAELRLRSASGAQGGFPTGSDAWRDAATGLWTREYARDILPIEFQRAVRYGYPLACLVVALDNFDQLCETRGSDRAEQLLSELAQTIGRSLRSCDICCQFDDRTILALLPNTSLEGTVMVARRLREIARRLGDEQDPPRPLTVTIGGYTLSDSNVTNADDLLQKAREALKEAQERGTDNACMRGGYRWDLSKPREVFRDDRPSRRR